jgi:hypothetical protein
VQPRRAGDRLLVSRLDGDTDRGRDGNDLCSGASPRCGSGAVRVSTRLPPPSAIKLNIYNGTGERLADRRIANAVPNLAGRVAEDLRARGFPVNKVDDNPQRFDHIARLNYGPRAFGAAAVVRGFFLNKAEPGGFDRTRTDDLVDVTLGRGFTKLGSRTEVSVAWAALGRPSPPPGACGDPA